MTSVSDRQAARQNGNRKFTADIIKELKEMTNAADEDIQMALQECNGDVNRAAMSIIDSEYRGGVLHLILRCEYRSLNIRMQIHFKR